VSTEGEIDSVGDFEVLNAYTFLSLDAAAWNTSDQCVFYLLDPVGWFLNIIHG
jgi:hypothetical protein